MIPDGLELLKNMNISDMATCNISQFIKASAKFFMFKDLENSLPGGPTCDAFYGIHKGCRFFPSAKKYDLWGLRCF